MAEEDEMSGTASVADANTALNFLLLPAHTAQLVTPASAEARLRICPTQPQFPKNPA